MIVCISSNITRTNPNRNHRTYFVETRHLNFAILITEKVRPNAGVHTSKAREQSSEVKGHTLFDEETNISRHSLYSVDPRATKSSTQLKTQLRTILFNCSNIRRDRHQKFRPC